MKRPTHCDRLLAVLSDGRPRTHRELYRLGMVVHSRISELRKRGHEIAQWRATEGGEPVYVYQLLPPGREPKAGHPASRATVSQAGHPVEPASRSETDITELLERHGFTDVDAQLSLVGA